MNSIVGNSKSKSMVEKSAQVIFTVCAFFAVLAVVSITAYMILSGTPALSQVGIAELLFGTVWKPTAAEPSYGILYVILTSIVGTTMAIILVNAMFMPALVAIACSMNREKSVTIAMII